MPTFKKFSTPDIGNVFGGRTAVALKATDAARFEPGRVIPAGGPRAAAGQPPTFDWALYLPEGKSLARVVAPGARFVTTNQRDVSLAAHDVSSNVWDFNYAGSGLNMFIIRVVGTDRALTVSAR